MRRLAVALMVFTGLAAYTGQASAQNLRPGISQQSNRTPAFSPYLNLLRSGNSAGFNYYGIVRPQLEFRDNIGNIQNDVDINRQLIQNANNGTGQGYDPFALTTGHTAVFLNNGGYFLNSNPGRGLGLLGQGGQNGRGQVSQNRMGSGQGAGGATPARGRR